MKKGIYVAVDILLFYKNEILLIKRARKPYAGFYAFPGGFVKENERIKKAALRELREETGIKLKQNQLKFFCYADKPNRDPRGRVISFVFYVLLREKPEVKASRREIAKAEWFKINKALKLKLAFDHKEILKSLVSFLKP